MRKVGMVDRIYVKPSEDGMTVKGWIRTNEDRFYFFKQNNAQTQTNDLRNKIVQFDTIKEPNHAAMRAVNIELLSEVKAA